MTVWPYSVHDDDKPYETKLTFTPHFTTHDFHVILSQVTTYCHILLSYSTVIFYCHILLSCDDRLYGCDSMSYCQTVKLFHLTNLRPLLIPIVTDCEIYELFLSCAFSNYNLFYCLRQLLHRPSWRLYCPVCVCGLNLKKSPKKWNTFDEIPQKVEQIWWNPPKVEEVRWNPPKVE